MIYKYPVPVNNYSVIHASDLPGFNNWYESNDFQNISYGDDGTVCLVYPSLLLQEVINSDDYANYEKLVEVLEEIVNDQNNIFISISD